jgi:hypothetical protein
MSAGPLPQRKTVSAAVRAAEGKLVNVSPRDTHNAELVRRTKKAIADLDAAHERYCVRLATRQIKRAAALRLECDKRDRGAKQRVDDVRASLDGPIDPALGASLLEEAEGWAEVARSQNKLAELSHDAQNRMDRAIRAWGDRFVVVALRAASSKDGGRAFLRKVSKGVDWGLGGVAFVPPLAIYAAAAAVAKMAGDYAVRRFEKLPRADADERYETALATLAVATRLMRAWGREIK